MMKTKLRLEDAEREINNLNLKIYKACGLSHIYANRNDLSSQTKVVDSLLDFTNEYKSLVEGIENIEDKKRFNKNLKSVLNLYKIHKDLLANTKNHLLIQERGIQNEI